MRKKILVLGVIAILITMLFVLTGCGSNKTSNSIINELNSVIDEMDDYKVGNIQSVFEEKTKYRLLDSSREEFKEKPSSSNSQFGFGALSEQLINTGAQYVLIYDTKDETYYSVSVSYQSYKPVCMKARKIK